jgi:hypothetical protein
LHKAKPFIGENGGGHDEFPDAKRYQKLKRSFTTCSMARAYARSP